MEHEEDQQVPDTTSASEETSITETSVPAQDIDYPAELERVIKERNDKALELDQAQHRIIELKQDKKSTADEPDIAAIATKAAQDAVAHTRAEDRIEQQASSTAEAQLVKYHYHNSIVKTGNLTEDIENSFALANRKKVVQQLSEIKRAVAVPKAASTSTSGGQRTEVQTAIELTPEERVIAQRYNLTPEEIAKSRG